DLFTDVQAQAHAASAPRDGIFSLIEQTKDGLELIAGYPHARILDAHHQAVAVVTQAKLDRSAIGRELDGVAHQVVEYLFEMIAIGINRVLRSAFKIQLDPVHGGRQLHSPGDLAEEVGHVNRLQAELELARLDPRDDQQFVDQTAQPRRL